MKKRILAVLLAVVMVIGFAPAFETPAQAAGSERSIEITAIGDVSLEYADFTDIAKFNVRLVNFSEEDLTNMNPIHVDQWYNMNYGNKEAYSNYIGLEARCTKITETEYTLEIRLENRRDGVRPRGNYYEFYFTVEDQTFAQMARVQCNLLTVVPGTFELAEPLDDLTLKASPNSKTAAIYEDDLNDLLPPRAEVVELVVLGGGSSFITEKYDDNVYSPKYYLQAKPAIGECTAEYYDVEVVCEYDASCYTSFVNPKLRVYLKYPGVEVIADDPTYAVECGKTGSATYSVEYTEADYNKAVIYWVDETGTYSATPPTGLTAALNGTKNGNTNDKITVNSTSSVPVGTYYFHVYMTDTGYKSEVMSYTVKRATYSGATTKTINIVSGLTEGQTEVVQMSPGGLQFGENPVQEGDWFTYQILDRSDTSIKLRITITAENGEVPENTPDGKLTFTVTSDKYETFDLVVNIHPLFKAVKITGSTGTLTYGSSSSRVTYTIQYDELNSNNAEFAWVGETPVGMNYQFNNSNKTLIINYSGLTPADTYPFTISVTEGGKAYSATGNVVINKAAVPGDIDNAVSGKLLYLQNSVLSIDLVEAGAIVTGGTAAVKTNETGWTANVTDNVFTVTNPTEIPEETAPKTITLEVTSQNYETYEITATVIPLYKEVTVGSQESGLTYSTGGSTTFDVGNTQLANAPITITWFDKNDTQITAPAGVTVKLDDVDFGNDTKLGSGAQTLTITTSNTTPAGIYKFVITAKDGEEDTYSSEPATFTVDKDTFTDAENKTATLHCHMGTSVDFANQVPADIAADLDDVKVTTSSSAYTASYNKDTGEITLARTWNLAQTVANLADQTVTLTVSGGDSANYADYTFDVTVTPDFKVLSAERPTAVVSENNTLTVANPTSGVSFRLVGDNITTGWFSNAEKVFAPLEAGEYVIEVCYSGLTSIDEALIAGYITSLAPLTTVDVERNVADLADGDVTLSASYNDNFVSGSDEATYFYQNNAWYKLTEAGKLTVTTSGENCTAGVNDDAYAFEAFELTLDDVNTSGSVDFSADSVSIVVDGMVNTGAIKAVDLVITGKGTAAMDAITITANSTNAIKATGELTVAGLDEFNVNTPGNHSIIASDDLVIGTESAGIGSVNITSGGSTSVLSNNGTVTIENVDSLNISRIVQGYNYVTIKNVGTFNGQNLIVSSGTGVFLDTIGTVSVANIDAYTGAGISITNVDTFIGNLLNANKNIVFDNVGTITTGNIKSTNGDIAIKNFDALSVNGTIVATNGDVTIDGNGDAVMEDGKDTNTSTDAQVNLLGSISAGDTVTIDGLKELLIVCASGNAVQGTNCVIINNIAQFGINAEYDPDEEPVMTVCDNGVVTGAAGSITFTDVDKFTLFIGEKGLAAKNVTLENSFGEITAVNTSGNEKAVDATTEFLILVKSVVVKSGESKQTASTVTLGEKIIGEDTVKAVVASTDVNVYFSVARPANNTYKVPVSNDEESVTITATISGTEATIKSVDLDKVKDLVSDEKAAGNVVIDLTGTKKNINGVAIPKSVLEAITTAAEDANNKTEHLVIKLPTAEMVFDDAALRAILEQADGSVIKFHFDDVGLTRMNAAQKEAVKELDVRKGFEAYITVNGQRISDFKGGEVEIIVPYAVGEGEKVAGFSVWYIDEEGNPEKLKSTYDGKEKCFAVKHFSDYVIAYSEEDALAGSYHICPQDETCPIHPFGDTDKLAWYHDGVHYCIENGYMKGISIEEFAPTMITNRAMIATILWRMEGEPAADYEMTFEDVAEGLWYTEAIRWAQSVGVVEGYSDEAFGPNDSITREQMATILWRYCKYKGIDVSVGENTNILSYEDAFDVSSWAMEAMQWACGSGMIQGIAKDNTMYLDPQGDAVRSQSATIIYRFCEELKK